MFWASLEFHHWIERSKGRIDTYENGRLLGDDFSDCKCHTNIKKLKREVGIY